MQYRRNFHEYHSYESIPPTGEVATKTLETRPLSARRTCQARRVNLGSTLLDRGPPKESRFPNGLAEINRGGYPLSVNSLQAIIFLSLLLAPEILLGRRLLRYEPAIVECRGRLRLVYFPGSPNYQSIKDGDKREGVYILELEEPFDIAAANDPNKPLNDSEGWGKNVQRIQLISDGTLEKRVGKKVTVRGMLFEAIFGRHHTSVLMEVLKVTGK